MSSRPPQYETTGPAFNTAPLKHFIQEKFPGAMVLEEHQVMRLRTLIKDTFN